MQLLLSVLSTVLLAGTAPAAAWMSWRMWRWIEARV